VPVIGRTGRSIASWMASLGWEAATLRLKEGGPFASRRGAGRYSRDAGGWTLKQ